MKRIVLWGVATMLLLVLAFPGLTVLASESVEVAELHTVDETGRGVNAVPVELRPTR